LGEEAHLNTSFKHFIYFVQEFNLINKRELQPLAELIDSLTKTDEEKKGSSAKVTGGGIFLILLFCGSFVYVVVGVVINKFVRHQEGIEILPNVAFWTGFFGLIRDGGKFIVNKTCRRGGYTQV